MILKEVVLNNFRNYALQTVQLGSGTNVFFGNNAQGKTNFLESVRYMSIGKSMRTSREKELIKWDEECARIKAVVQSGQVSKRLDVALYQQKSKTVKINSVPISKMGELMGVVATVLFSPDEIGIIKNAPSDRRRFIDISLCQLSKAYFYALNRYNKILLQRNTLLKSGRADENSLAVWDIQLVSEGARIAKSRAGFIKRLEELAKANHAYLSSDKEELTLEYEGITGESSEEISEKMTAKLKEDREKDLRQGYTHSGIQTDDLKVSVNGTDIRKFGSQGQQRTAALSLKMAEVDLYNQEKGEYPILLLDDVFSELDKTRQKRLLQKINGLQTIITCTHFEFENVGGRYFKVTNGSIQPVDADNSY
ncbi:MAG: DNA replication/repair protein RecF [Clostridia bacterium]|nr:DNA replication/repair protein RecF [Clostridia bacterium]